MMGKKRCGSGLDGPNPLRAVPSVHPSFLRSAPGSLDLLDDEVVELRLDLFRCVVIRHA
jgi:hypothetical protein